jgi:hypothetical protein
VKTKTPEQYLTRYRRRGAAAGPKTRRSDRRRTTIIWPEDDYAYRSKPNHSARAVALPLKPLGPPRRPVQKDHPSTLPLSAEDRIDRYARQTGRTLLTPQQARRVLQKERANLAF